MKIINAMVLFLYPLRSIDLLSCYKICLTLSYHPKILHIRNHLTVAALLILFLTNQANACWSSAEEEELEDGEIDFGNFTNYTNITNFTYIPSIPIPKFSFGMNLSSKDLWNGWEPPPGAGGYESFIEEFKKHLKEYYDSRGETLGMDKPSDAGSSWPATWTGVGLGMPGMQPPPWSFVPYNLGMPAFCLDRPDPGPCEKQTKKKRFAFNAYMEDCYEFDYCSFGNKNNFLTKQKCIEACMETVEGGCDPESKINIRLL